MTESIRRELWFRSWPTWIWFAMQTIVPSVGLYAWNLFLPTVSFELYAVVFVSKLHLHRKDLNVQWAAHVSYVLSVFFLLLIKSQATGVDQWILVMLIETIAILLFSFRKCVLWVEGLLLLWLVVHPIWYLLSGDVAQHFSQIFLISTFLILYSYERNYRVQIAYERDHDSVTGLMNRRGFFDCFVDRQDRNITGTLVVIDLDDFKQVNDTYGHDVGDHVLIEVGRRLSNFVEKKGSVVRWGGDEFILVLPNMNIDQAREWVTHLHRELVFAPIPLFNREEQISLRVSMGVATGGIKEDLFRRADHVLLEVKRQGKNDVHFIHE